MLREVIHRVINNLLDRLDEFGSRRSARSRFWRANEGIALVLVVGTLLGLGLFAAAAVTSSDSQTANSARSGAQLTASSAGAVATEVVTETVKRKGETVRVIGHRRSRLGPTVQGVVTLPARTVRDTRTVTTSEIATVTDVQPVTVTVLETVTCKPKSC